MAKQVKNIELTFENIDYIVIPAYYFLDFSLEDIRTRICRAAANAVLRYNVVDKVELVIKKAADNEAAHFEGDIHGLDNGDTTLFERISLYNDLTAIKLIYMDDTEEEYMLPWEDEENDEYRNRLQKSAVIESGDLWVRIQKQ